MTDGKVMLYMRLPAHREEIEILRLELEPEYVLTEARILAAALQPIHVSLSAITNHGTQVHYWSWDKKK